MRDKVKYYNEVTLAGSQFTCTKCKQTKPGSAFGLRKMASGEIHNQAQCRECRHESKFPADTPVPLPGPGPQMTKEERRRAREQISPTPVEVDSGLWELVRTMFSPPPSPTEIQAALKRKR